MINDTFARLESSFDQLRRFTADASHELRTPLAVIRGIGEVGLGETRTPAEYKEAIGSMLEEVDRLTQPRRHAAPAVAWRRRDRPAVARSRSIWASWRARSCRRSAILAEERSQRFGVDFADGVSVSVDRLVLREAITNVVDNAIKYSPHGSTIDDSRACATAIRARLTVADEGPGIAAEHRERIFDRFFRLDEARSRDSGGAGLGLAIAKWAVEVNGGHISVEARRGRGSVFRSRFRRSPATSTLTNTRSAQRGQA